jgi:hypothetical protein
MEHGIITATYYENGVVKCDVQALRVDTEYDKVPVLRSAAALTVMPAIKQKVTMEKLGGERFITNVMAALEPDSRPDEIDSNEFALQFDADTKLTFTKNDSGDYDIDIQASGDVTINGISFSNHVHSTDTGTTGTPE